MLSIRTMQSTQFLALQIWHEGYVFHSARSEFMLQYFEVMAIGWLSLHLPAYTHSVVCHKDRYFRSVENGDIEWLENPQTSWVQIWHNWLYLPLDFKCQNWWLHVKGRWYSKSHISWSMNYEPIILKKSSTDWSKVGKTFEWKDSLFIFYVLNILLKQ